MLIKYTQEAPLLGGQRNSSGGDITPQLKYRWLALKLYHPILVIFAGPVQMGKASWIQTEQHVQTGRWAVHPSGWLSAGRADYQIGQAQYSPLPVSGVGSSLCYIKWRKGIGSIIFRSALPWYVLPILRLINIPPLGCQYHNTIGGKLWQQHFFSSRMGGLVFTCHLLGTF